MVNTLASLKMEWDKEIAPVLRAQSIAKQLIPVNPLLSGKGIGVLSIDSLKYVARGAAAINYDIQQNIEDTVDITGDTFRIPLQQDDVIIKRRDWDAYALQNIPLEADLAQDMAANIAAQQSTLIVDGWKSDGTNYDVKGMYQVANNTVSGADFDTWGNAYKTAAAMIAALKADKIYSKGYNFTIASLNYTELMGSLASTGIREYQLVLDLINSDAGGAMPGQILESTDLAAGTAMMSPIASQENRRYFDLVETQVPKNHLWFTDGNTESGDVHARQIGAMVPRFKHLNSSGKDDCVCTATGLDSS